MKLIDEDKVVAEIERMLHETVNNTDGSPYYGGRAGAFTSILSFIDTLETKDVIAEQECTCNEALNRIIGGSWNLLCPVNKLGLKTGDKVKVIIKAQKGK